MKIEYFNFEGFENVYLEDSFVLNIRTSEILAEFLVDIVLIEKHQLYSKPKSDEVYCYKKAKLSFPNVEKIVWIEVYIYPSIDANNEVDFGNIDLFFYENDFYNLSGDWGELKIQSQSPIIKFIDE